jgi:membrane-associated phospholipid phosphatase
MKFARALAVVVLLANAQVAAAQSVGKMLEDDARNVGKDVWAVWSSPFDATRKDWLLTVGALGAFGVSMLADQSVSDWAIRNDSSSFFKALSPVRRGGKLFAGKYVVPPVAVAYVVGIAIKNQDLRDAVTGCMSSWGAQSVLRKALYATIGRARPTISPNDPQQWDFLPDGWDWHSFPAGHFANAMACATFWDKRFSLGPGSILVYGLAGAVGIGRFADKAHWFSDTVLGGILGYAVGNEIARRSLARDLERAQQSGTQLFVAPTGPGYNMGLRFEF